MSELARCGKVPPTNVIGNNEILSIQPDCTDSERFESFRICPATRAAQRGPNATMALYKQLLTTSKQIAGSTTLVKENDEIIVLDFNVHAGDHTLASVMLMAEGYKLKHYMVKSRNKNSAASVDFTTKRLGSFLAQKWLRHEMVLTDDSGNPVAPTPAASLTALTSEDKQYLKSINVLDAYEGVTSWQSKLAVTMVSGSSILINPAKLAEFNTAPPSVREVLQSLQKKHEETFEKILHGKLDDAPSTDPRPGTGTEDPRVDGADETAAGPPAALPQLADEKALRAAFTIAAESKIMDQRNVSMLVSECGQAFLVAKD